MRGDTIVAPAAEVTGTSTCRSRLRVVAENGASKTLYDKPPASREFSSNVVVCEKVKHHTELSCKVV